MSAGGLAPRLAIGRRASRTFRREWRQQLVVLGLLAATVATASFLASLIFNTTDVRHRARFGSAQHRYEAEADFEDLLPVIDAVANDYGPVDVVARWTAPVPGLADTVDYLSLDPDGRLSAPMIGLVDGTFPTKSSDAAVTRDLGALLNLGLGDIVEFDGTRRTVVGLVENPADLERQFLLVAPSEAPQATSFALLFDGPGNGADLTASEAFGSAQLDEAALDTVDSVSRGLVTAGVTAAAQVVLVLVCLVAAAGFTAIAHRRRQQLGMLAAIGATRHHLAWVVAANGLTLGAVAAAIGMATGIGSWLIVADRLEEPVGFRIEAWNIPWVLVAATSAATVITATIAAWIPGRAAARTSPVTALSGRPPKLQPVTGTALTGLGTIVLGLGLVVLADGQVVLFSLGALAGVVGFLMLSPAVTRILGQMGSPLPLPGRLALRDIGRNRARSAFSLAAISLALGIAAAIIIVSAADDDDAMFPNLPANETVLWSQDPSQPDNVSSFYTADPNDEGISPFLPRLDDADLERLEAAVHAALDDLGASIVPLRVAVDPKAVTGGGGLLAVTVARPAEIGSVDVAHVYEATEPLVSSEALERAGNRLLTTATGPRPGPSDLVAGDGQLLFTNAAAPPDAVGPVLTFPDTFTSRPTALLTTEAITARGWDTRTVGWLIQADRNLLPEQLSMLRELGFREGFVVEAPEPIPDRSTLRWTALAVGAGVVLIVLQSTLGLIRLETAGDLRILTAAGASRQTRRATAAVTASTMAGAGALLGTIGAYLIVAGYLPDRTVLYPLPAGHLAGLIAGVPLGAALIAGATTKRDPGHLGRAPLQ